MSCTAAFATGLRAKVGGCLAVLLVPVAAVWGETSFSPVHLPLVHSTALAPTTPLSYPLLSQVLARFAAEPTALATQRARNLLSTHLARLAQLGPSTRPESFPREEETIAYLVNAHMAWTVALTAEPGLAQLPVAELRTIPFPLDGRRTTLASLAQEILARAPAEPRLVLFLNPGLAEGPPLPPWPLEGHSLAWQLERHAHRCGAQPSFWRLDEARRELAAGAFTAFMPGLPATAHQRAARLLELVPPPPPLYARIVAVCGPTLQRCTHTVSPLPSTRW